MVKLLWENLYKKEKSEQDTQAILKACPIFSTLTNRELKFVSKVVHMRNYRPGEPIFRQDEVGVGMYIIVKGTVSIDVEEFGLGDAPPKSVFVTRLDSGDFFGEISLVENNGRRTATATACDEVIVLGFFKPDLNDIAERNPVIGYKIMNRLAEVLGKRLHDTANKVSLLKREINKSNSPL